MKINKVSIKVANKKEVVGDCFVDDGYVQGGRISLPDIDCDFQSDRRNDIKEYMESRYNSDGTQNVFSAGTFTTERFKAAFKDVCRTHKIPTSTAMYLSSIIDDKTTFTLFFAQCLANKKLMDFVRKFPIVIEDIRELLDSPKTTSIHASAVVITPKYKNGKRMECFDYLPIRMAEGGLLVSEYDGYSVEEVGLLKEDILATKELTKVKTILQYVNDNYKEKVKEILLSIGITNRDRLELEDIHTNLLDEPKAYEIFQRGQTQNIFQFSGQSMSKFISNLMPNNINDIIAACALYRPATIEIGAHEDYIKYKHGEAEPVYDYGCYEDTKETFGIQIYQEQTMLIAQHLAGFTLSEADMLRKAIGKKRIDLMLALKDKFINGAMANDCPKVEANAIWDKIELAGKYSFNKCISGDTELEKIWYKASGLDFTVEELYKIKNDEQYANSVGLGILNFEYNKSGYPYMRSRGYDGVLLNNKIKDIRYEGYREVFELTLKGGRSIKTTANHKFPTTNGEKMLCDIDINKDKIFATWDYEGFNISDNLTYRFQIESINKIGFEDVYDIEMEDPYHTFAIRNGIVTCNSHSTAYSLISYDAAWLKAIFPTAFYTVALEFCNNDKMNLVVSEMNAFTECRVVAPDINGSRISFTADYKTNEIFWGFTRIKQVGEATAELIVEERDSRGDFVDFCDFYVRTAALIDYKKAKAKENGEKFMSPLNKTKFVNLIISGCFDKIYGIKNIQERYDIIKYYCELSSNDLDEIKMDEGDKAEHYYWSSQQIKISGIGSTDYRRIFDASDNEKVARQYAYRTAKDILDIRNEGKRCFICGTVIEVKEKSGKAKSTGKPYSCGEVIIQQNEEIVHYSMWNETWELHRSEVINSKDAIIIANGMIKYNDYQEKNVINGGKTATIKIIK